MPLRRFESCRIRLIHYTQYYFCKKDWSMSKEDLEFPGEPIVQGKGPSALEFPGEPIVRVKDPSALEFPEVPRAQTGGVKHDLVFPEGEEAREAKSTQVDTKGKEAQKLGARVKESQEQCALTRTHSGTETLEEHLESSEERRKSGSPLCASPRPGWAFNSYLFSIFSYLIMIFSFRCMVYWNTWDY